MVGEILTEATICSSTHALEREGRWRGWSSASNRRLIRPGRFASRHRAVPRVSRSVPTREQGPEIDPDPLIGALTRIADLPTLAA